MRSNDRAKKWAMDDKEEKLAVIDWLQKMKGIELSKFINKQASSHQGGGESNPANKTKALLKKFLNSVFRRFIVAIDSQGGNFICLNDDFFSEMISNLTYMLTVINSYSLSDMLIVLQKVNFSMIENGQFITGLTLFDVLLKYVQNPSCTYMSDANGKPQLTEQQYIRFMTKIDELRDCFSEIPNFDISLKESTKTEVVQVPQSVDDQYSHIKSYFISLLNECLHCELNTSKTNQPKLQVLESQIEDMKNKEKGVEQFEWVRVLFISWILSNFSALIGAPQAFRAVCNYLRIPRDTPELSSIGLQADIEQAAQVIMDTLSHKGLGFKLCKYLCASSLPVDFKNIEIIGDYIEAVTRWLAPKKNLSPPFKVMALWMIKALVFNLCNRYSEHKTFMQSIFARNHSRKRQIANTLWSLFESGDIDCVHQNAKMLQKVKELKEAAKAIEHGQEKGRLWETLELLDIVLSLPVVKMEICKRTPKLSEAMPVHPLPYWNTTLGNDAPPMAVLIDPNDKENRAVKDNCEVGLAVNDVKEKPLLKISQQLVLDNGGGKNNVNYSNNSYVITASNGGGGEDTGKQKSKVIKPETPSNGGGGEDTGKQKNEVIKPETPLRRKSFCNLQNQSADDQLFQIADPKSHISYLLQWYKQDHMDLLQHRWRLLSSVQQNKIKEMSTEYTEEQQAILASIFEEPLDVAPDIEKESLNKDPDNVCAGGALPSQLGC